MRILLTADTYGGVGSFARELALGLAERGHVIVLASLGEPTDTTWIGDRAISFHRSPLRLEWMSAGAEDLAASRRWLEGLIAAFAPDLLHANQFAFACFAATLPVVLTVHSDVVSWWRAVHGAAPPSPWREWYGELAAGALAAASAVVVPSAAAAADLRASFGFAGPIALIANGLTPLPPTSPPRRQDITAIAAGRLWDAGKQIQLLLRPDLPLPVRIAGPSQPPIGAGASAAAFPALPQITLLGEMSRRALAAEFGRASVFIGPSRYEPFGLAALEAASAGCALLLNDIPSYREIWGATAAYFRRDDGDSLVRQLQALAADDPRRRRLASAARHRARRLYSRRRMTAHYLRLYCSLASRATRARAAAAA
ncbi:MAG: glycosyltransferase family 4 protein [Terriglobales bacterium]